MQGTCSRNYGTRHSSMFQISLAYWAIVLSLLNFPLPAVLKIDIFSHFFLSLHANHMNKIIYIGQITCFRSANTFYYWLKFMRKHNRDSLLPIHFIDFCLSIHVAWEVMTNKKVITTTITRISFQRFKQWTVVIASKHPTPDKLLCLFKSRIRFELQITKNGNVNRTTLVEISSFLHVF